MVSIEDFEVRCRRELEALQLMKLLPVAMGVPVTLSMAKAHQVRVYPGCWRFELRLRLTLIMEAADAGSIALSRQARSRCHFESIQRLEESQESMMVGTD